MTATVAGAALLFAQAQPAVDRGVSGTTITFGLEEQVNSFSTDEENLGFRLAFQEANAAGPIHGRTIAWKGYARGGGDAAAEAVANATRLIDDDGVLALVNWGGPQSVTLLALTASRRVPYLFPHSALVSSAGQRHLFTSFPRFEGEAAVMFPYLARDRKLTRLGIVHDVNAYGQLFLERLTSLAGSSGYTVAGALPIDSRDRAALARYHEDRPRNRYSLYGYVYGRLIVEGLRRAGRDLTRERLVDALESIREWDAGGTMPPVSFSASDHHAQPAGFVCELDAGRFKPLSGWIEP